MSQDMRRKLQPGNLVPRRKQVRPTTGQAKRWLTLAVIAGLILVLSLVGIPDFSSLREYSQTLGPWFPVAFWCAYVFFTLFPLPRTLWTVSAGLLFGPWWGLLLAITALTASAALTVAGLRYATDNATIRSLENPRAKQLSSYLQARGWVAIFGLRMVAGVPFFVLNYAAAFAPIALNRFLLATCLGSVPTTLLGVFFGDALSGDTDPFLVVLTIAISLSGLLIVALDARNNTLKSSL